MARLASKRGELRGKRTREEREREEKEKKGEHGGKAYGGHMRVRACVHIGCRSRYHCHEFRCATESSRAYDPRLTPSAVFL